jgi:hypothetical protein
MPGGTFTVRTTISPGNYAWVEVEDSDPTRCHGLDIVRALATDCGIDGDDAVRVVWARFDWLSHA